MSTVVHTVLLTIITLDKIQNTAHKPLLTTYPEGCNIWWEAVDNEQHLPNKTENDVEYELYSMYNCVVYVMDVIPWPPSTRPFGSPLVSSSIVLSDPPLRVHGKADVNTAFIFWIGAIQHVHPKETFNFDNHNC